MATERATTIDDPARDDFESDRSIRIRTEHLSVIPLAAAAAMAAAGGRWAWPVATMLLATAYLFVYLRFRHHRSAEA